MPRCFFRNAGSKTAGCRALTLIELLVVMAIMLILIAMLLPAFAGARMNARRNVCTSNQRALMTGYQMYARENNRFLMGADNGSSDDWIGKGNSIKALEKGTMWPYMESADFYQCPDQVYSNFLNSYSINARLNGGQSKASKAGSAGNWTKRHWTSNMIDSKQVVFMEKDDYRGLSANSFMLGIQKGKFVDLVPANHDGGDNLGFLDGHAESWHWEDPDLRIRPKHKPAPTFLFFDPGNVDWDRLDPVFMTWPK